MPRQRRGRFFIRVHVSFQLGYGPKSVRGRGWISKILLNTRFKVVEPQKFVAQQLCNTHCAQIQKFRHIRTIRSSFKQAMPLKQFWCLSYTHGIILFPIPAMVYYINDLDNQLCRRGRGVPKILYAEDVFLQNYKLSLSQLKNFSNQMDFLEKLTNFAQIFYLMSVLHKKPSKVCKFIQKVHLIGKILKLAQ